MNLLLLFCVSVKEWFRIGTELRKESILFFFALLFFFFNMDSDFFALVVGTIITWLLTNYILNMVSFCFYSDCF